MTKENITSQKAISTVTCCNILITVLTLYDKREHHFSESDSTQIQEQKLATTSKTIW